jgi:nitroreductase
MAPIKEAKTNQPVHELIKKRWSPRSFSSEKILKEELKTLFEAMSWAASARNAQPWQIIVGSKGENQTYQKIYDCLDEWNQKWAINAPVLGVVVAKKNIENQLNPSYAYDCGAAMATLAIQAASQDIYIHQMGGINAQKTMETFEIPAAEYEVLCGIAIGRLGGLEHLDSYYHPMETSSRQRNAIASFVFGDKWGAPNEELL